MLFPILFKFLEIYPINHNLYTELLMCQLLCVVACVCTYVSVCMCVCMYFISSFNPYNNPKRGVDRGLSNSIKVAQQVNSLARTQILGNTLPDSTVLPKSTLLFVLALLVFPFPSLPSPFFSHSFLTSFLPHFSISKRIESTYKLLATTYPHTHTYIHMHAYLYTDIRTLSCEAIRAKQQRRM